MLNAVSASAYSIGSTGGGGFEEPSRLQEEFDEDDFQRILVRQEAVSSPDVILETQHRERLMNMNLPIVFCGSWCPICVGAQGREDPHCKGINEDIDNESPAVSMDYKEISEYDESKTKTTMTVCRDT